MPARRAAGPLVAALALAVVLPAGPAAALDTLKVAVAQRGQWDTAITELGQRSGIMAKRGIAVEILYTQGGPEAYQAVISGSMDIACGGGIESAVGAYSKGAPVRIIASAMIGSPDTYWFVPAGSPITSLREAGGKTISYSQNGSSSHAALLSLLDQYKVEARPVSTGGHPATLTMTMTGQIDIGRGAAPFGLELVDEGKIRIVARGSEIRARSDQTVRVCLANAGALGKRGEAIARLMQGYRDTIDWMYSDPAAFAAYEDFSHVRHELMEKVRDQYFPKSTLWPDEIRGLDLVLADSLKNKFIAKPLSPAEVAEMIRIPAPLK
jgi:ABC-type nitrate/sulfonate/bicarbonate transport system substrate-binding protein